MIRAAALAAAGLAIAAFAATPATRHVEAQDAPPISDCDGLTEGVGLLMQGSQLELRYLDALAGRQDILILLVCSQLAPEALAAAGIGDCRELMTEEP